MMTETEREEQRKLVSLTDDIIDADRLKQIALNAHIMLVCFPDRSNARIFKALHPSWTVLYKVN